MARLVKPTVKSSKQEAIPLAEPTKRCGTIWGMEDQRLT